MAVLHDRQQKSVSAVCLCDFYCSQQYFCVANSVTSYR